MRGRGAIDDLLRATLCVGLGLAVDQVSRNPWPDVTP